VAETKREDERETRKNIGHSERDIDTQVSDPGPVPDDPPASGEISTSAELEKLKAEKEELLQTLIRRQADFENFRKRTERDRFEEGRRGVERLVSDLVPVLDAFDRALKAHDEDPAYEEYRKGVTLIRKQLWDTLARHGVQRIEAADKMFDPHVHQAIERVESAELPDGLIVGVFQDGYLFHGRVLRPAIVRVAVHPAESENPPTDEI
jgi:molecular chaperone GrpE